MSDTKSLKVLEENAKMQKLHAQVILDKHVPWDVVSKESDAGSRT